MISIRTQALSIIFVATLCAMPFFAHAAVEGATGGAPNPVCVAWVNSGKKTPPPVCTEMTPLGPSTGLCVEVLCKGQKAPGLDGGQGALSGAMQFLQQAMQMFGKGGGGGGGSTPPASTNPLGTPPAPNTTNTLLNGLNDAFNPSNNDSTDNSSVDSIFQSLFGNDDGSESNNGDAETGAGNSTTTEEDNIDFIQAVGDGFGQIRNDVANVTGGANNTNGEGEDGPSSAGAERSEVRTGDSGTTLEAEVREGDTAVGGFYGGAGIGAQSSNMIGRLCSNRPWAGSIVARVISDTFFDGLCTRLGFTPGEEITVSAPTDVTNTEAQARMRIAEERAAEAAARGMHCPLGVRPGELAKLEFSCGEARLEETVGFDIDSEVAQSVIVSPTSASQYGIVCSDGFESFCSVQVVDPRLVIWADPATVVLGSRTTIFWNTEDVLKGSCSVKGPSFSERGEFGGASTVPINTASTFSLTCTGGDGVTTTAEVLVDLAI